MSKPMKVRVQNMLSEDALAEIESIEITLESGKVVKLNVAAELAVFADPVKFHKQAETAHSRYAFWEYQAARALTRVRERETDLAKLEGDRRYRYSKVLKEEDRYVASSTVEGMLAGDNAVLSARNELTQLREHWSILKAIAGAHDHRAHLLRRLLARDQDSSRG